LEYGFKNILTLRAAFAYEKGILNPDERTNAYNGMTGGFSIDLPMSKGGDNTFGVDYSYRHSNPFSGSHAIGVRILIN
jgi:hypothetical protein